MTQGKTEQQRIGRRDERGTMVAQRIRILQLCRNLRYFSRYLMQFLQKRIICGGFSFQAMAMAYIHAVLQQFR